MCYAEHMNKSESATYISVALAVMAGLVIIVFFIAQGVIHASDQKTERINTCVSAGGTWISQYTMCIAPDKDVR